MFIRFKNSFGKLPPMVGVDLGLLFSGAVREVRYLAPFSLGGRDGDGVSTS
jgi:hypothetical protein